MPLRSMTGFAQVTGQVSPEVRFTLSLKSVNHRFLDVHFRLPADSDALEMKLRRLLKEIASGQNVTGDTTTLEDFSVLAKLASAEE